MRSCDGHHHAEIFSLGKALPPSGSAEGAGLDHEGSGVPLPYLTDDPTIRYVLAGETPSSVFEAVPLALAYG